MCLRLSSVEPRPTVTVHVAKRSMWLQNFNFRNTLRNTMAQNYFEGFVELDCSWIGNLVYGWLQSTRSPLTAILKKIRLVSLDLLHSSSPKDKKNNNTLKLQAIKYSDSSWTMLLSTKGLSTLRRDLNCAWYYYLNLHCTTCVSLCCRKVGCMGSAWNSLFLNYRMCLFVF
jgi:hypothetical protein